MYRMNGMHLIKTVLHDIREDNNMISLNIIIVLTTVFLFETKFTVGGKSDEKCNEYMQLSRQRRDNHGVNNMGKIEASPHEFPHMAVLINDYNSMRCGGSLISEQYVLTCAHCLTSNEPIRKVRLGDLNIASSADDADVQEFTVVSAILHPDFDMPKSINDIGLLKLDRPVTFTKAVHPACLQVEEQIGTDKAVATGWGVLNKMTYERSDTLMKVELDLYTNEECSEHYKDKVGLDNLPIRITKDMICSGGKTEVKGTCRRDSGGPLQILRDGKPNVYNIIGVISFGPRCGKVNFPEVETRVSSYVPWLESVMYSGGFASWHVPRAPRLAGPGIIIMIVINKLL